MTVSELIDALELSPLHVEDEGRAEVTDAYCGDLLSDVLAHAQPDSVWFTVQAHTNIVAVASLRDVACVVVVNGIAPDPQTVVKAREQGVTLCGSRESAAELCLRLAGKFQA